MAQVQSKEKIQLLELAKIAMFHNEKPQVTIGLGKNADGTFNNQMAHFANWDKEKHIDIKGLNVNGKAKPDGTPGKPYIKIKLTIGEGAGRTFYNAAIFPNNKKLQNDPDYTGTIDLTSDYQGPKLDLKGWNKEGRESGVPFIGLTITDPAAPIIKPSAALNSAPAHSAAPTSDPETSMPPANWNENPGEIPF